MYMLLIEGFFSVLILHAYLVNINFVVNMFMKSIGLLQVVAHTEVGITI